MSEADEAALLEALFEEVRKDHSLARYVPRKERIGEDNTPREEYKRLVAAELAVVRAAAAPTGDGSARKEAASALKAAYGKIMKIEKKSGEDNPRDSESSTFEHSLRGVISGVNSDERIASIREKAEMEVRRQSYAEEIAARRAAGADIREARAARRAAGGSRDR